MICMVYHKGKIKRWNKTYMTEYDVQEKMKIKTE